MSHLFAGIAGASIVLAAPQDPEWSILIAASLIAAIGLHLAEREQ